MISPEKKVQLFCVNYPPETTGIAPYTGGLATGLARSGFIVHVVTAQPHYPSWSIDKEYKKWYSKTSNLKVLVERVLHFVPSKPAPISRLFSEITFGMRAAARRKTKIDCTLLVSPALFSSAIIMLMLKSFNKNAPVIVWIQDLYAVGLLETGTSSRMPFKVALAVEKWLLLRANKVIVIHDGFAAQLVEMYGIDRQSIKVISNWSHVQQVTVFDRQLERHKYSWGADELVVLHTGNMGLKQGLLNVVEAARLADSTSHKIRFVLCGDGSERQLLEQQAEGLKKIQFLKPVDDESYTKLLKSADILLVNELPGVQEMSVPSKLTSYFQAGKPILAASTEGGNTSSEILNSGGGVVISSGNPELLLKSTLQLSNNQALMTKLSHNGREYASKYLDEKEAISKFVSEIESLL
jgi:glycosyltransferase involved in cell wall biosynthesis